MPILQENLWGRNANFSGEGFAENTFNVKAMPQQEFADWVKEVKQTAEPLTEDKFAELLEPGHLGQLTFTGTHLDFMPPPEGHHGGEGTHGSNADDHPREQHEKTDEDQVDSSEANRSQTTENHHEGQH